MFMVLLDTETRKLSGEELGAIRGLWSSWCVAGDFNQVRFPEERSRVGRLTEEMRRFSKVFEDLEFKGLAIVGGMFYMEWGSTKSLKGKK